MLQMTNTWNEFPKVLCNSNVQNQKIPKKLKIQKIPKKQCLRQDPPVGGGRILVFLVFLDFFFFIFVFLVFLVFLVVFGIFVFLVFLVFLFFCFFLFFGIFVFLFLVNYLFIHLLSCPVQNVLKHVFFYIVFSLYICMKYWCAGVLGGWPYIYI